MECRRRGRERRLVNAAAASRLTARKSRLGLHVNRPWWSSTDARVMTKHSQTLSHRGDIIVLLLLVMSVRKLISGCVIFLSYAYVQDWELIWTVKFHTEMLLISRQGQSKLTVWNIMYTMYVWKLEVTGKMGCSTKVTWSDFSLGLSKKKRALKFALNRVKSFIIFTCFKCRENV